MFVGRRGKAWEGAGADTIVVSRGAISGGSTSQDVPGVRAAKAARGARAAQLLRLCSWGRGPSMRSNSGSEGAGLRDGPFRRRQAPPPCPTATRVPSPCPPLRSDRLQVWVSESGLDLPGLPSGGVAPDVWDCAQDHELVIVKRLAAPDGSAAAPGDAETGALPNGLEFQLVQGYRATGTEEGFGLSQWQASGHPFAAAEGFGPARLRQLLAHLRAYAGNAVWDPENHRRAFGMREDRFADARYWPALSFRELRDDAILGWGERPLSDRLAAVRRDGLAPRRAVRGGRSEAEAP